MKRARRTGVRRHADWSTKPSAACCTWRSRSRRSMSSAPPGFVMVLEDTSELLRAQKAAAWHEVARRVAHEIKNPLTPIALSRRAHRPPAGPPRAAAGNARASCGSAPPPSRAKWRSVQDAGGRVLAVRALSRRAAGALRPERSGGERARRLRRPAGRHSSRTRSLRPACRRSMSIASSSSAWW